jgi:hypothetical protein
MAWSLLKGVCGRTSFYHDNLDDRNAVRACQVLRALPLSSQFGEYSAIRGNFDGESNGYLVQEVAECFRAGAGQRQMGP